MTGIFADVSNFSGVPSPTLEFPWEQIGLPQVRSFSTNAPDTFIELAVLDGPARRRLVGPGNMYTWAVEFICTKNRAQAFEGFYFDTTLQGMEWFNIPLSTAQGMQMCAVREASPYQMVREGTAYRYQWQLEGYPGDLLPGEPPPTILPPTEPIIDFIDGGGAADTLTDFIDNGTASDNFIDFITGGDAKS